MRYRDRLNCHSQVTRMLQAEMASNSMNKIIHTWEQQFGRAFICTGVTLKWAPGHENLLAMTGRSGGYISLGAIAVPVTM